MHTLLEFLRRYNYFFLFLLLEVVSFTLLFRFNSYQGSVWLTSANRFATKANALYAEGEAFVQLRDVNTELARHNLILQRQNDVLREALARKGVRAEETDSIMRAAMQNYSLIPALVINNAIQRRDNYLVINRGSEDGVEPEQGVVGGKGVVGIVYLCEAHSSLVLPLTNRKSNLSCRVRGENYFGSLTWDGKDFRYASLDDIPRYAKVKKGDVVETSGYSAVFPPGLFVGRVTEVKNSADGQSYNLTVLLATDFSTIRDASVISTPYKANIDSLQVRLDRTEGTL